MTVTLGIFLPPDQGHAGCFEVKSRLLPGEVPAVEEREETTVITGVIASMTSYLALLLCTLQ